MGGTGSRLRNNSQPIPRFPNCVEKWFLLRICALKLLLHRSYACLLLGRNVHCSAIYSVEGSHGFNCI